jgi:ubiquinone/menaquinone biosynthesis C-methylase UbiE
MMHAGNPVRPANSPARDMSKSASSAEPEAMVKRQSSGTQRQRSESPFRGLVTTPARNTADLRRFFDQCAATGSTEQHGRARRLLEYRLSLMRRPRPTDVVLDLGCGTGHPLLGLGSEVVRGIGIDISPSMIELARTRLRSSPWRAKHAFEVDDAEALTTIGDQSVDLAICVGAFEHMLDKRAVLARIHRVLKSHGRFFCLTPHADYIWYRTIAPLLGFATKHLSSDRLRTREEFLALLDEAGFRRSQAGRWTFIPKGDMPRLVAIPLTVLDAIRRHARLDWLRGGLSLCVRKEAGAP